MIVKWAIPKIDRDDICRLISTCLYHKLQCEIKTCKKMSVTGLELHEAATLGDYDALEEYLKAGKFDVNQKDVDCSNKTPLHWACQKGYAEIIRLLLENGANGTARTVVGWTPAHCAAEGGRINALRALHAAQIPVDFKDKYGDTPRRISEIYGHEECIRYLLQAEAELAERRKNGEVVEEEDIDYKEDEEDDYDNDLHSYEENKPVVLPKNNPKFKD